MGLVKFESLIHVSLPNVRLKKNWASKLIGLEMARVFFFMLMFIGIADFFITLAICFRQQQELGKFGHMKKASIGASITMCKNFHN